jgi:hypothetical protein
MFVKFAGLTPELSFLRSSHSFATQRMADAQVFSYVDVLRTLRRSINKGGQLYSAESPSLHASRTHLLMCVARAADSGDYSGCYETYLAAANEVAQHSNDEDIRGILDKAKADVLQLSNPTEQAWAPWRGRRCRCASDSSSSGDGFGGGQRRPVHERRGQGEGGEGGDEGHVRVPRGV